MSHCVCCVLDYSTGACWNCDGDTITNYSGYPYNVYNYLSDENEQKKGKFIGIGSDRIVSILYIKREILASSTYSFCTGKPVSNYIENIKDRISEFKVFK